MVIGALALAMLGVFNERPHAVADLPALERRIGFVFPPGTLLVEGIGGHGFPDTLAVLTMPREEALRLVTDPRFEARPIQTRPGQRLVRDGDNWPKPPRLSYWHPDLARSYRSVTWRELYMGFDMLADLDRPNVAVVYVVWTPMRTGGW